MFDEHDLYPVHESAVVPNDVLHELLARHAKRAVPENPIHELVTRYLRDALSAYLPGKWVTGGICMYLEPASAKEYVAPDVLVVDGPAPGPMRPVYLKWADPPALLVVEVGSKSTFLADEGPKPAVYGGRLAVPDYLYYHPERHELRLYRLREESYGEALPDARGWLHSEGLNVWFGVDDAGQLRVHTPEGEMLLTHEESERARRDAEARAREQAGRAQREAAAHAAAERRVAELEERLRRLGEEP